MARLSIRMIDTLMACRPLCAGKALPRVSRFISLSIFAPIPIPISLSRFIPLSIFIPVSRFIPVSLMVFLLASPLVSANSSAVHLRDAGIDQENALSEKAARDCALYQGAIPVIRSKFEGIKEIRFHSKITPLRDGVKGGSLTLKDCGFGANEPGIKVMAELQTPQSFNLNFTPIWYSKPGRNYSASANIYVYWFVAGFHGYRIDIKDIDTNPVYTISDVIYLLDDPVMCRKLPIPERCRDKKDPMDLYLCTVAHYHYHQPSDNVCLLRHHQ
ncbi:hypothetical protein [Kordiimonas sp. SCSIO 12610]|uniref:hypothetical protein n=1 Tax=Kordiimonas sp. SCSIO 12610 TaxID=2829597 RepID=UPI00210EA47E|nr:hypothetical protein [Kordiimonas sp. SCSIO 12610]UTW56156.1 hypothetical protein KFF44_04470 [Kordiimonas sp. SCSIO 12610]